MVWKHQLNSPRPGIDNVAPYYGVSSPFKHAPKVQRNFKFQHEKVGVKSYGVYKPYRTKTLPDNFQLQNFPWKGEFKKYATVEPVGRFNVRALTERDYQHMQRDAVTGKVVAQNAANINKVKAPTGRVEDRLIRFVVEKGLEKEYNTVGQWIYLIVVDGIIMKIGGSSVSLKSRMEGYLKGVETRGKNPQMSNTNGKIYNTMLNALFKYNRNIEIYAKRYQPPQKVDIKVAGIMYKLDPAIYEQIEGILIALYCLHFGEKPPWSTASNIEARRLAITKYDSHRRAL